MGFVEFFEVIPLYLFSRNNLELDLDYEYVKKNGNWVLASHGPLQS